MVGCMGLVSCFVCLVLLLLVGWFVLGAFLHLFWIRSLLETHSATETTFFSTAIAEIIHQNL